MVSLGRVGGLEPGVFGDLIGWGAGYFCDTRLPKIGEVFKQSITVGGDGCDHNLFSGAPAKQMTLGCLQKRGELKHNSIFMKTGWLRKEGLWFHIT